MSMIAMLMLGFGIGTCAARLETKDQMLAFLRAHPSRAYFSRLMRDGPYDVAMEVGVADGRFLEHFLIDAQPKTWYMVEPFPNKMLQARYPPSTSGRRAPRRTRGARANRRASGSRPGTAATTHYERAAAQEARVTATSGFGLAAKQLLEGATLDYKDGLEQSGFAITNPNASRPCGCGQSFS